MAQSRPLGQHAGKKRRVVDVAGINPDRVETVGERLDPGAADQPKTRLVADNAAKRGRADHRARGLRAKAERHHAVGDRRGRAARRAAGSVRRVVRVCGPARGEGREFGGDGLAEHDRTRGAGERHARGVRRRPMAVIDRRAIGGRHIDVSIRSLTAIGTRAAARAAPRGRGPRLGQRLVAVEILPRSRRHPRALRSGRDRTAINASAVSRRSAICRAASRAGNKRGSVIAISIFQSIAGRRSYPQRQKHSGVKTPAASLPA